LAISDVINGGDNPLAKLVFYSAISDAVKLNDAAITQHILQTIINDSALLGDTIKGGLLYYKTLSDSITASDTPSTKAILNIQISDGITLGDVLLTSLIYENLSRIRAGRYGVKPDTSWTSDVTKTGRYGKAE